jgi:hypothetical protein
MKTPSPAALKAADDINYKLTLGWSSWDEANAADIIDAAFADATVAALQQRLIERTEQSMATALRDAETIRQLRAALSALTPPHRMDCADSNISVTPETCVCPDHVKAAHKLLTP